MSKMLLLSFVTLLLFGACTSIEPFVYEGYNYSGWMDNFTGSDCPNKYYSVIKFVVVDPLVLPDGYVINRTIDVYQWHHVNGSYGTSYSMPYGSYGNGSCTMIMYYVDYSNLPEIKFKELGEEK